MRATRVAPAVFRRLSTIVPEDRATCDAVFLTFDLDWAEDSVIHDTVDLVEAAGVEATWFITHRTPALNRLFSNPKFEVGIHPNFDRVPLDDAKPRDLKAVLGSLMELAPDAVCLRSHSLWSSTRLLQLMPEFGLTHESNIYIPPDAPPPVSAFRNWNGVIRVPHSYADDAFLVSACAHKGEFSASMRTYAATPGLKVLDFHPIHVYLNSETVARYESTRALHKDPARLRRLRHGGEGTRTALETLLMWSRCGSR